MFKTALGIGVVAAGLTFGQAARAALQAYDGFNYSAAAPLNGSNGGTGAWDSAWRAAASPNLTDNIAAAGLSYPGLVVSGLAADTTNAATSIDFRDIGPYSSGDLWISFLARAEAANSITGGSNFFGLSTYEGTDASSGAVMSIAKNSGTSKWGLVAFPTSTAGSGPNGTGTTNLGIVNNDLPDIVVNTTYLLVTKFHFATGAGADTADSVSLYVNPTPGASVPATASVEYIDATAPTTGGISFDRIRIGTQNGRDWLVDEIRIGDTFADVAPAIPPNTDFDGIGGTTLTDFHILRAHYLNTGAAHADGDANSDGVVNHVDFFMWRSAFVMSGGSLDGVSLDVPEPATALGVTIATCALGVVGRRRRHG